MRTVAAIGLGLCLALGLVGPASAQQNPTAGQARNRGVIEAVNGRTITMTTLTGRHLAVDVPQGTLIAAVQMGCMKDIVPGAYIGSAARTLPDGT
ncbi:MAG: hypothetical protein JOZ05_20200, partial [Acetobacteraceae bacterium]|nr:hypothetical protein [Acetobacteraceae bacterium]